MQLALSACQKEKEPKPDYLEWKGQASQSINGDPVLTLLNCRSLQSEQEHYYFIPHMQWPNKNDLTQTTNEEGHFITFITHANFVYEQVKLSENTTMYNYLYNTPISFKIIKENPSSYYYEVIANNLTVASFAGHNAESLKEIKENEAFIIVHFDGLNYKIIKHPESILVNETFTCQNNGQTHSKTLQQ